MDIDDLLTEVMFHLFKNEELIENLKSKARKTNLLLEVKLPGTIADDNFSVNIYEKPDKVNYLREILPKYKKVRLEDTREECSICLEQYKVNSYKRTLNCNHHFHKKCIDKWLKKCTEDNLHCPMCRHQYTIPLEFINNFTIEKSIE
jgi:hypothetical protein